MARGRGALGSVISRFHPMLVTGPIGVLSGNERSDVGAVDEHGRGEPVLYARHVDNGAGAEQSADRVVEIEYPTGPRAEVVPEVLA